MTAESGNTATAESPNVAREASRSTAGRNAGRKGRVATAALGATLAVLGLRRRTLGGIAASVAGGWLVYRSLAGGDSGADERGGSGATTGATTVERTVTVGESADELYEFWRDPENAADVWGHFAEVTSVGEDRQRWRAELPFGRTATWETRIVEDRSGEFLRWESAPDARLSAEGSVAFRPAPGNRGTEVTLRVRFDPPGGSVGHAVAERLGVVSSAVVGTALQRFKSLAETGEYPTTERNPSARGNGDVI
ncbi:MULTISPECIES: SRPBCC family protein [Halorussus]|uniref:SRPBCC family protein n=1 Tax=Halorussus TaxID=1070314 RepID=UPI00209E97B8|nr:SRPBCC family protein [Halorussus vallis]USZ74868.1 SRPBCC family protein [Halorussus vallis]